MKSIKFRPNVVAVIIHPTEKKVLMFRRLAKRNEKGELLSDGGQLRWNWQFPQGGVDSVETEEKALFRELEEEIGTRDVNIIRSSKTRIRYHYPRKMLYILHQQPIWKPFRGQQQRWYLVELNCDVHSNHHVLNLLLYLHSHNFVRQHIYNKNDVLFHNT